MDHRHYNRSPGCRNTSDPLLQADPLTYRPHNWNPFVFSCQ